MKLGQICRQKKEEPRGSCEPECAFSKLEPPPAGVMHGLVRNQIPLGGLRYADVLGARVCHWMPAMHYGAQGGPSYSGR